ncbi:MAG: YjgP/YjgQ family permease [Rikenellaceae bacterium]|nr:YjgP/YjgQ family permease [Rikenellaceae bacterium]
MKTIHKLVLKAYLGPLIMTFFIVTFVLMMNFVWRFIEDLTGKGLSADVILELIFYATINMIPLGLPLAMLLAGIMTMGNMGENFELQAMKSAGMSLMRIMQPLIIVTFIISVASFFLVNNLVPYAYKRSMIILSDIKRQKQVLEFKDGLFFNGIHEDMSIRVEHQDPETGLLHNVLIYDSRSQGGNMTTTMAETGYIRLSDDKKFLLVTLYNGDNYQQTRNSRWYTKNSLRHDKFDVQDMAIRMEGFDFQQSDNTMVNSSQAKNIVELQHAIDSLDVTVEEAIARSYDPLLRDNLFTNDIQVLQLPDSMKIDKSEFTDVYLLDSLPKLTMRERNEIWKTAKTMAQNSRQSFSYDEGSAKDGLNQLYRSKNDWHKKLSLPFSVIIFFMIGAPLGAIIRKGGMGTPIVISVVFFVIYYVISLSGEKMAKEGTWSSFSGIWISSFILTPIAIYLMIKATNDSSLLDTDWYDAQFKKIKKKFAPVWLPIAKRVTSTPAWRKMREKIKQRRLNRAK